MGGLSLIGSQEAALHKMRSANDSIAPFFPPKTLCNMKILKPAASAKYERAEDKQQKLDKNDNFYLALGVSYEWDSCARD